MEGTTDVSRTHLRAILYSVPAIYGVVTAYVGLSFFEGILQTVTLAMAVFGTLAAYVLLKRIYESQYGVRL